MSISLMDGLGRYDSNAYKPSNGEGGQLDQKVKVIYDYTVSFRQA